MLCNSYEITMQTRIGPRYGTMSVQCNEGEINGFLDLLEQHNFFSGSVDEQGVCQISGQLKTLMRTIFYSATGKITNDFVSLRLQAKNEEFKVTGTAILSHKNPIRN